MSKSNNTTKKFNKTEEFKIYGQNAVHAAFKHRPNEIISFYLTKNLLPKFSELTKFLALNKKAYHLVETSDLDNITQSTHHEGVCLVITKKKFAPYKEFLRQHKGHHCSLLALENVTNPHNLGAIIRSAAHFGIDAVIVQDLSSCDNGACFRTSEGGMESLEVLEVKDFHQLIADLFELKFQICTTSSHATQSLFETTIEKKVCFLFGEEAKGLSKSLLQKTNPVMIPGTHDIESLNVSVAAGIFMGEYWRQTQTKN